MKKLIRSVLNHLGYEIIKVPKTPWRSKEQGVRVGNFNIRMPNVNPLIKTYHDDPGFASEISRITRTVLSKYPGMTALDIGANVGDTLALLKSVDNIPVISIEGDPFSFGYLRKNAHQFSKITLLNQYLGEHSGAQNIRLDKAGWNTTLIPDAQTGTSIELKTLDDLLTGTGADISTIHLMKIDTEGFDTVILRGAIRILRETSPVIYMEYNRDNMAAIGEDGLSTLLNLRTYGYSHMLVYDDRGRYMVAESLENTAAVTNLHEYADGKKSSIYYYNFCLFHKKDADLFNSLKTLEIQHR